MLIVFIMFTFLFICLVTIVAKATQPIDETFVPHYAGGGPREPPPFMLFNSPMQLRIVDNSLSTGRITFPKRDSPLLAYNHGELIGSADCYLGFDEELKLFARCGNQTLSLN